MNVPDIIVIAIIAFAVFFALRHICKKKKGGCSCGCAECDRACGTARRK